MNKCTNEIRKTSLPDEALKWLKDFSVIDIQGSNCSKTLYPQCQGPTRVPALLHACPACPPRWACSAYTQAAGSVGSQHPRSDPPSGKDGN